MDREAEVKRAESERREPAARRLYRRPVLTVYGSIAKLTRTGGSTRFEAGVPAMRMACL